MGKANYIFNKSDDNENANILIDGEISAWWGVGLREMAKEIANSNASNIMMQINSGGGSVFEGMAISAYIKGSPINIDTCIMGLCASIATPIALSGNNTSIASGSQFMIHNASVVIHGESSDLRGTADLLDSIDAQLVDVYVKAIEKNGKLINGSIEETKAQVTKWQNEETWFTAEKAVEHGFIGKVVEGGEFLNRSKAIEIYNSCSKFKNVPTEFLNKVKTFADMPNDTNEEQKATEGMFKKFMAFMGSEKTKEVPAAEEPKAELTKEQKIEAAKALLIAENLYSEPEANDETETVDASSDLQARLDAAEKARVAAELKAQKLEEEKHAAPSAGPRKGTETVKNKKTIENLIAGQTETVDAMFKSIFN